jgi:DNA mismatch repair protein MutS
MAIEGADYLAQKLQCLTLFATHYFELTELADELPATSNVHVNAKEHGDTIAFLHTVTEGAANQSFGLQVAKLAGVPENVIQQAKLKLKELETAHHGSHNSVPAETNEKQPSLPLEPTQPNPILEQLKTTDLNNLSPRQALDLLFSWQNKL